jgi:hypothetical protein
MSKTFAVIINNIVNNLIIADTVEVAETVSGHTCIEYIDHTTVGIGWTYDGTNFIAPEPEVINDAQQAALSTPMVAE